MAIKGLQTDKPGLPRAGIIRLGRKVETGKKDKNGNPIMRPVESPHFVLTDAPGVADAIGTNTPTELNIYFPFDEIDLVFPAYMHNFNASSLVCRGDGERILYAIDSQSGKAIVKDGTCLVEFTEQMFDTKRVTHHPGDVMNCPGTNRDLYAKCAFCKPNAMLLVLLRDIPRLAYYQIATTSIHNIVELTQQLNNVRQIIGNLTGTPRLTGVPFILKRIPRKISTPKNGGGRQRVEKYLLQLEIDPEWVLNMAMAQRSLVDPARLLAIPTNVTIESPVYQTAPPVQSGYTDPPVWEAVEDIEDQQEELDQISYSTPDDLLYAIGQATGLTETDAKGLLKRADYKGFSVAKSAAMYADAIKQYNAEKKPITIEQPALIETDPQPQGVGAAYADQVSF